MTDKDLNKRLHEGLAKIEKMYPSPKREKLSPFIEEFLECITRDIPKISNEDYNRIYAEGVKNTLKHIIEIINK